MSSDDKRYMALGFRVRHSYKRRSGSRVARCMLCGTKRRAVSSGYEYLAGAGPQNFPWSMNNPPCIKKVIEAPVTVASAAATKPFAHLTPHRDTQEMMIHVYWSGLGDAHDDGRGHLVMRNKIAADVGLGFVPVPGPTEAEMQEVTYHAKMAMIRVLRKRKKMR